MGTYRIVWSFYYVNCAYVKNDSQNTELQLVCCGKNLRFFNCYKFWIVIVINSVKSANGLHPKDGKALPDVTCHVTVVLHNKQLDPSFNSYNALEWQQKGLVREVRTTKFAKATLSPVWNETFNLWAAWVPFKPKSFNLCGCFFLSQNFKWSCSGISSHWNMVCFCWSHWCQFPLYTALI